MFSAGASLLDPRLTTHAAFVRYLDRFCDAARKTGQLPVLVRHPYDRSGGHAAAAARSEGFGQLLAPPPPAAARFAPDLPR